MDRDHCKRDKSYQTYSICDSSVSFVHLVLVGFWIYKFHCEGSHTYTQIVLSHQPYHLKTRLAETKDNLLPFASHADGRTNTSLSCKYIPSF